MKPTLAYCFCALLLFQSFGRELLVASYALNKARITARYCVNKARPQLHCDGQCHLRRQLRQTEGAGDQKAPAGPVAQVRFEVLPAGAPFRLRSPWRGPAPAPPYARCRAPRPADAPATAVFRPPVLNG